MEEDNCNSQRMRICCDGFHNLNSNFGTSLELCCIFGKWVLQFAMIHFPPLPLGTPVVRRDLDKNFGVVFANGFLLYFDNNLA